MNHSFSTPSVPVSPPSREASRSRCERWHDWVSDLRLYGMAIGPIKSPVVEPVVIRAVVRWPKGGNPLGETIRAWVVAGISRGLHLAHIVPSDYQSRIDLEWRLVAASEVGTDITIESVAREVGHV